MWERHRYLPPRLRGDMATPTAIALDSSFNLLLISRILVDTNGNGRHHVIIGINHGCALVIARRGETTHSGVDVNNTHLSMINPLNHRIYIVIYPSTCCVYVTWDQSYMDDILQATFSVASSLMKTFEFQVKWYRNKIWFGPSWQYQEHRQGWFE